MDEHNGGRVWAYSELDYLREKWPTTTTVTAIADRLGRSRRGVICKAQELKLFPVNMPWPAAHDEYVRKNYPGEMDIFSICDVVKRSAWCIHSKARKLGVRRPKRKNLPAWASKFIKQNADSMSVEELAQKTEQSVMRVKNILRARERSLCSVTSQESALRKIKNLRGDDVAIARLYAGQKYEDVRLKN